MTDTPSIRKAARIEGHRLLLRDAEESDSAFIFALRTGEAAAHISATAPDLASQVAWLARYARGDDAAYFIVGGQDGRALRTTQLYDPLGDSFAWGSWILKPEAPRFAAIESALIVYRYALDHLDFTAAYFSVREENRKIWQVHERFGARRVGTAGGQHHFRIDRPTIVASLERYRRFLPDGIRVMR